MTQLWKEKHTTPWDLLESFHKKVNQYEWETPDHWVSEYRDISAKVHKGKNVEIQPYALFTGEVYLDDNVRIGPYSFIRGPVYIGPNSCIGPHCEVIRCIIGSNTTIAHKNVIADSVFGDSINFAGYSATCNLPVGRSYINACYQTNKEKVHRKFGATIDDGCNIGCFSVLMPGSYVPPNKNIVGQCIVTGSKVRSFVKGNGFECLANGLHTHPNLEDQLSSDVLSQD